MNAKFIHAMVLSGFLVGILASGRAQTAPASATVVPPPGAVTAQTAGEGLGFQFVSGEPAISTHVVKGAPYSLEATIETTQTLADGNRIVHRQTVHVYRDSVGRTRREETLAAIGPWAALGTPPTMITIQDPVSGANYFLDPLQKVATKLPSTPNGQRVMVTPDAGSGPASASVSSAPMAAGFVSGGEEGGVERARA